MKLSTRKNRQPDQKGRQAIKKARRLTLKAYRPWLLTIFKRTLERNLGRG